MRQGQAQHTRGTIISPTSSSVPPLPEPTSTWSDPKTIRARLISDERIPDRYECSVRIQPAGRSRFRRQALARNHGAPIPACDVITLAEIQKGIELLAEGKRRAQLEKWLTQDLEAWFSGRVLPVDRQVAMRWASLSAQGSRTGRPLPTVDSLIAATALAYDLTIVTRNTKDFEGIGATTLNPWDAA